MKRVPQSAGEARTNGSDEAASWIRRFSAPVLRTAQECIRETGAARDQQGAAAARGDHHVPETRRTENGTHPGDDRRAASAVERPHREGHPGGRLRAGSCIARPSIPT